MNLVNFEDLKKESFKNLKDQSILIIGKFETFHLGHQKLIKSAFDYGQINNLKVNILIYSEFNFKPIFSLDSRLAFLKKYSFDNVILFAPTKENYKITIQEFINLMKTNLNIKSFFVGSDFTFNKNDNDLEVMANLIDVNIVDLVKINGVKISSELIRNSLELSELDLVNKLLNRNYFYEGIIYAGEQNGSKIGFPTANISSKETIMIGMGIYISFLIMDNKKYPSVTSVYTNDTIQHSNEKVYFETYILNFKDYIYGKKVKVELLEKIRDPKWYPNIKELQKAIQKDVDKSIKFFKQMS